MSQRSDHINFEWRHFLKDAGVTAFRWHDMRHHFASRLVIGGVDLKIVRELLGRSDYAMTLAKLASKMGRHRKSALRAVQPF
ncbi:tyrosine-type recombinase/integrase [Sphingobium sp.]|uniref:tyrosine-type recombinase/integrase n=1 Tax=Sphingobium sp. TaxID=1912891 RepID=UPI0025E1385E|nr:tyrosine-type recombinase/integrase [Sphingobium sp.]